MDKIQIFQRSFSLLLTLAVVLLVNQTAHAQPITVQLPTLRVFSVNTTVMVPDGGTMSLGGIGRSAMGSVSRGVPGLGSIPGLGRGFRNRAIGTDTGASNASVSANIISMKEMEKEVLDAAEQSRARNSHLGPSESVRRKANFITNNVGRQKQQR